MIAFRFFFFLLVVLSILREFVLKLIKVERGKEIESLRDENPSRSEMKKFVNKAFGRLSVVSFRLNDPSS